MNKQLTLLDTTSTAVERDVARRDSKKARSTKKHAQIQRATTEPWWKLSEADKQRGLNGVRSIRAILDKKTDFEGISYAQAS